MSRQAQRQKNGAEAAAATPILYLTNGPESAGAGDKESYKSMAVPSLFDNLMQHALTFIPDTWDSINFAELLIQED
jgi:hypothetical protein